MPELQISPNAKIVKEPIFFPNRFFSFQLLLLTSTLTLLLKLPSNHPINPAKSYHRLDYLVAIRHYLKF